jgi:predicted AlkP superfamily phosphohydrolase/phosphomutase
MAPRLVIIGLDCAEPTLVAQWRADLPTLDRLMQQGSFGRLESCIPAITVPAWSCMLSGRDPGELGIYGFRNRADRSYGKLVVADSRAVRQPRLWDYLSEAGWKVGVVSVPGSYPPPTVNGALVSCFLAPSTASDYTFPPSFAERISGWLGGEAYLLDIPEFRSFDKERILHDIYTLCDHRFLVARQLLAEEQPDFLMLVDMGTDRIHHAFWKHMDAHHPQFVENSPLKDAIYNYYRHVDAQIAGLLADCGPETAVLVVSDHGARPLMGGFCINEWLVQQGELVLAEQPTSPIPLDKAQIDWKRTRAWSAGGYYGRIFLNVKGREPEGIIAPSEYEQVRSALAEQLRQIPGPDGVLLGNRVFTPQQLYQNVRGVAPDLLVYFGDLAWRAVGVVGGGELYVQENDTGPDDANHAQHGLLIWYDPEQPGAGRELGDLSMYDVLPTLLTHCGLTPPAGLRGQVGRW